MWTWHNSSSTLSGFQWSHTILSGCSMNAKPIWKLHVTNLKIPAADRLIKINRNLLWRWSQPSQNLPYWIRFRPPLVDVRLPRRLLWQHGNRVLYPLRHRALLLKRRENPVSNPSIPGSNQANSLQMVHLHWRRAWHSPLLPTRQAPEMVRYCWHRVTEPGA